MRYRKLHREKFYRNSKKFSYQNLHEWIFDNVCSIDNKLCLYPPVNYRTLLLYDITDPYLSLSNQTVANFVADGEVNFSWLVLLLIDRV